MTRGFVYAREGNKTLLDANRLVWKICSATLWGLILLLGLTAARPAAAAIAYVQGAYETAATGTTVTVKYASAQNAGDLNVVVMAWVSSAATVVKESEPNRGRQFFATGGFG